MNMKLKKRVISVALTLAMVLGMLPMQFLGGSVSVSAATAYDVATEAETEAPTTGTTEEPSSEAPEETTAATPEETTATPEETTAAPEETTAATETPSNVDGFTVETPAADTTYVFDFGANCSDIANSYSKGLFSFSAGSYHGASYNGPQYGVEFKSGNKLTFAVAGDCTIVIGGDNNSSCTNLAATSTTGTVTPATNSTKTAGHCTLEECLAKGANALVYSYDGEAGTVTLELDPGYTGTGNTKAYICYAAIIPGTTEVAPEVKVNVSGKVADAEGAVNGVASGKLVFANSKSVKTEATIGTDGTYTVELVVGDTYAVSIEGVDYTLEGTLDLTAATADVTDNNYVATFVEPPKTTDLSPTVNPLPTVVKNYKVGYEGEAGSYTQNADNSFTIVGGGQYFGKDTKIDSLYTAGFKVPEGSTVYFNAKLTAAVADGTTSGMLGIMGKNDITEPDAMAYGVYWDVSKGNWRIARHGGASNVSGADLATPIYVKVEMKSDGTYTTIATDSSFADDKVIQARKGMGVTPCAPTYVGFFATEGTTLTAEDIEIAIEYTEEGATTATKKIVYSSAYGELIPIYTDSASTGGQAVDGITCTTTVDGNEIRLTSTRTSSKGDIRSNKGVNYFLFPATTENWTIQTDATIHSINSGTDKQGIAVGVTGTVAGKLYGSWLQANKSSAMQHNFMNTAGSANGGNPKGSSIDINGGTYTMSYKRSTGSYDSGTGATEYALGYGLMNAWDAAGTQVVDGTTYPFDYTNGAAAYQTGASVQYALAVSVADITIANTKLINEAGYVIYDQNDYYIVKGVAPVVAEVTAVAKDDRTAIDLAWTLDPSVEGKGNVNYIIQVSVDGGEYTKAGQVKVQEFSYPVKATGEYKFKVWAISGESSTADSAKESNAVSVLMPLAKATLTAVGDADSVNLSWSVVENATSYDVYRAVTSEGEFAVLTNVAAPAEGDAVTFDDTTAEAEVPVYYYVVAKNDGNTSNPSETMQALVSEGHSYEYLVGNEADDLTITSKTNDTFFAEDGTFEIKGSYAVDGSAVLYVNGVAGEAVPCTAGAEVTFSGVAVDGRNDVEIIFTNADGGKSREVFNFVLNPVYDILVDAAYEGTEGEGEVPTYKTINAALAAVPADNAKQVVIFVKNGVYNERVVVTAPNVSILGEDKEETKQHAAVAVADKSATGMWDRNAMYVDSTANNFTLENIWVENSFPYTNGNDQQADAIAIVADNVLVINANLIGYQDTVLVDSRLKENGNYKVTNQYFYKCYITGNVDFIYGGGSAAFEDCDVVARYTSYKADGCFTAARTYENMEYGLIFNNCRFWKEAQVGDAQYRLARPWGADASTVFLNCYMDSVVQEVGYGDMSGNSYKNARFAEFNSSGAGYAVNNDRPLLSATQADKYATAKVLGEDFAYETVMAGMYAAPAEYTVTVTADDNGTAVADVAKAVAGTEVTLTATANTGYEFDAWVVVAGGVEVVDNKFTMPAADVEIKATFKEVAPADPVEAFISRMYTVALKRAEIDADGLANWVAQLKAGVLDGAGIAQFFVLGEEFKMKGFSNEEFVDILYLTFFDREADAEGKAYWVYVLEQGFSREFVLSNFVNLNEFTMICESFGIERGLMLENGTVVNPGIPQFVKRLYLIALDRAADNDGLKNYTMALLVKAETAESVAKKFLLSEEYAMRNRTNEEFVTDLYSVFMNREADADGVAYWTFCLAEGWSKEWAISEFAKSNEFKAIAASYGLE